MESTQQDDVVHNFPPFFRVHRDGTVHRFFESPVVPPTDTAAVMSKDVVVSPEPEVSARLFLPKSAAPTQKLPLLVYIHGGGFSIGSARSQFYSDYLASLVANSNVIAVSVEYRLAPEHPIPACYDDSWAVMKWLGTHMSGEGPDQWVNNHADFNRVFLAGDSAGANICHDMAVRVGADPLGCGVGISGMVLVHPFFGEGKVSEMWKVMCPDISGPDDPRLNPAADPGRMGRIGCGKVLVSVGGNDFLKERGWGYYEGLKKSGWGGEVEIEEVEGEGHVFHLFDPSTEKARMLMEKMASFFNE